MPSTIKYEVRIRFPPIKNGRMTWLHGKTHNTEESALKAAKDLPDDEKWVAVYKVTRERIWLHDGTEKGTGKPAGL